MRLKIQYVLAAALLALPAASTSASAQVFDNGTPDSRNGWSVSGGYRTMNDFVVASNTTLGSLNWYALYSSGKPATIQANYFVEIMNTVGGPAIWSSHVLNSTGTFTTYGCCSGVPTGNDTYSAYLFSADLGGLKLAAGNYWVGISQFASSTNGGGGSFWASSNARAGNQRLDGNGYNGYSTNSEGAFNITESTTSTPEPASMVLLGTGLAGIFGVARRRKAMKV